MIMPWDYPQYLLLITTDHGAFMAANKTQEECFAFQRDVIRVDRGFSVQGWSAIPLSEESYDLLYEVYQPLGRVLE